MNPSNKAFIIAEIAQAHDGSLGSAYKLVDAAVDAGANAVKFQIHFANHESDKQKDFFRDKKTNIQDKSRYEYWKRIEFTEKQWIELSNYCQKKNILFLASSFSDKSFTLLRKIDQHYWKVASGELNNHIFIKKVAKLNKEILLSTGLSDWNEINDALRLIKKYHNKITLMHCVSRYPCPANQIGLNIIPEMRERYPDINIGYSDHSGSLGAIIAAYTLGARVIECHIKLSNYSFGPDASSSILIDDFKKLVSEIRILEIVNDNVKNKNSLDKNQLNLRKMFNKSFYAAIDLKKGMILTSKNTILKKPVLGVHVSRYKAILGKKLINDVNKDKPIYEKDISEKD